MLVFSQRSVVSFLVISFALAPWASAIGQQVEPVALIAPEKDRGGWSMGLGREFPGAKGELKVTDETYREQPVLSLQADFRDDGNYIDAQVKLPEAPVEQISFWLNPPVGTTSVPIRLIDGTGQCHQLKLKLSDKGGWQQIVFPVDEYFRKVGTAAALDLTSSYEKWSGANDGRWHQPGKAFIVLCTKAMGEQPEIQLADVKLIPAPPTTQIEKTIPLDEILQLGEVDWRFNLGQEFPGAKGDVVVVKDEPKAGVNAMKLSADFTAGGAYVGIGKDFKSLAVEETNAIKLKMKSETTTQFGLRLVDATGQCHQRTAIAFKADGEWQEVEFIPTKIAGGEHWGGANDGKWHGPATFMELMLNTRSSEAKSSDLLISDIRADVVIEATQTPAAYYEGFEKEDAASTWQTSGDVTVADDGASKTKQSLKLSRTLEHLKDNTTATSKPFAVSAGLWQIGYAWRADLHSPDNSYHVSVDLEVLDGEGKVLESLPVEINFGKQDWHHVEKTVQIPKTASQARFVVAFKKTYGSFQIDELTAARLDVQPIEPRVERILISSAAVGNLFLPGDEIKLTVAVEAIKPLPAAEQTILASVRDYWGADQIQPKELKLEQVDKKDGRFRYEAALVLDDEQVMVGKFYELHVAVPQPPADPLTEYSGFAVLPVAASQKYEPLEIPFTIRNWDSRIPPYFQLADRLGIRQIGVWGGWSNQPPYKPQGPGIETVTKLGDLWITGTPASDVERNGFKNVTEESLREGMTNFLKAYGDKGLAKIALGNEPHGTGKVVEDNVRAYKAVYEAVKAYDEKIHVIGTSVEPNEEYFKNGYQNYLDAYDFHIYEHYTNVRKTMREYHELMKQYDAVKPIHSTELGLNSQGQTRLAVSREMLKKITSFFAEGGSMVSWFTIMYPDPKGNARGTFGDAHCMFDCKYNLYNPRLDAITHYHLLNAITVKKFAAEKHYPSGVQTYLFQDDAGNCLQVVWLDDDRQDVALPITAGKKVHVTYVDGTQQALVAGKNGVTLTAADEPILVTYNMEKDAKPSLADKLAAADLKLEATDQLTVAAGQPLEFTVTGTLADAKNLTLAAPPMWQSSLKQTADQQVTITLTPPADSPAREGIVFVTAKSKEDNVAEIRVPVKVK